MWTAKIWDQVVIDGYTFKGPVPIRHRGKIPVQLRNAANGRDVGSPVEGATGLCAGRDKHPCNG